MRGVKFFAIAFLLVISSSCNKSGCTKSEALNYAIDANFDDGSCSYYADAYIGKYRGSDSVWTKLGDTSFYTYGLTMFHPKKIEANLTYAENFVIQGIGQSFLLNNETVAFLDTGNFPVLMRNNFEFKKDSLFYSSATSYNDTIIQRNWGFAVRD